MTSPLAAISIGSLLSFAPWASDRQKRKDGMATKRRKGTEDLPVLHPDAAGIDVGTRELFIAVPADRDPEPVRSYPTFTKDLDSWHCAVALSCVTPPSCCASY